MKKNKKTHSKKSKFIPVKGDKQLQRESLQAKGYSDIRYSGKKNGFFAVK